MGKPVSIHPGSFSDDNGLLDVSTEDVVALYIDREKQRHKLAKDDENQQEDLVGFRVVPTGLVMALDANVRHLHITRALLTKCLSHQIMAWYESINRIRELTLLFNTAHDAANEYGYPDLYEDMRPSYIFANISPKQMSFRTIRWVKNGLASISTPLGVPTGALFVLGLCYSLTKTTNPSARGTVEKYLSVEVNRFSRHVEEQFVKVFRFHDLIRRRVAEDGLDNTITR